MNEAVKDRLGVQASRHDELSSAWGAAADMTKAAELREEAQRLAEAAMIHPDPDLIHRANHVDHLATAHASPAHGRLQQSHARAAEDLRALTEGRSPGYLTEPVGENPLDMELAEGERLPGAEPAEEVATDKPVKKRAN